MAREKGEKSATKGKDPRSSPLETSPLICAHFRSRENVYALSSRHFVRHPQRGRSDTRRGQPVGLQPNAISQTVGTIALGRPPRLAITKRLPRLLLSDRSRRLPATVLLQRRCGSAADYRLNSAFAVPERVSSAQTREGEASAPRGKGFLKGKTVGFSLERSSFGTFLST